MSQPLTILYQDEQLIAVDKPAGQLVHPADSPQPDDEVTMKILRDQIGQMVHAVHRIDRPTSGVLLFATDREATRLLQIAFETRRVEKTYWAVVNGSPAGGKTHWVCREPLQKSADAPPRTAETEFRILERFGDRFALIEAKPKTGRYHQIRRHLLHAGHPIVGDYRYAGVEHCDRVGEEFGIRTRMLLQSKRLEFFLPVSGAAVSVEAPADPLFERVRRQFC